MKTWKKIAILIICVIIFGYITKTVYIYRQNDFYRLHKNNENLVAQTKALFYNCASPDEKICRILSDNNIAYSNHDRSSRIAGIAIEKGTRTYGYFYQDESNSFSQEENFDLLWIYIGNDTGGADIKFDKNMKILTKRIAGDLPQDIVDSYYQEDAIKEYRIILDVLYQNWNNY